MVAAASLLFLAWNPKLGAPWKGPQQAGLWSCSLYLLHVPIGVYVLLRLRTAEVLQHRAGHVAYDFLVLALCLVLARWSYLWIERPSQDWGRRLARRWSQPTRTVVSS